MNLPDALPQLATQKRFWARWFWFREDGHAYAELTNYQQPVPPRDRHLLGDTFPMCRLDFLVAGGRGLRLEFGVDLGYFQFELLRPGAKPVQLGWDDQAHWHPHVLRWEELDFVCRCVTLADDRLTHPGLALLLLHRFTPITDGEDAGAVLALLRSAWRSVGVRDGRTIDRLVRRMDARGEGFDWQLDEKRGWTLRQDDWMSHDRGLYTLRSKGYRKFPFADLNATVERARKTCAQVVRPQWKTPAVKTLAAAAQAGDLDAMPALADALEEAGCNQAVILRHLRDRDEPARGAWVVESLAGAEWGTLVRQCAG
jgi:hypothetical protein